MSAVDELSRRVCALSVDSCSPPSQSSSPSPAASVCSPRWVPSSLPSWDSLHLLAASSARDAVADMVHAGTRALARSPRPDQLALALALVAKRDRAADDLGLDLAMENPMDPASMDAKVEVAALIGEEEVASARYFARGRVGNAPFRPGGLGDEEEERQAHAKQKVSARNAAFLTEEAINVSLVALGMSESAQACMLKVPAGMEEFAEELQGLAFRSRGKGEGEKGELGDGKDEVVSSVYHREERDWFDQEKNEGGNTSTPARETNRAKLLEFADSFISDDEDDDDMDDYLGYSDDDHFVENERDVQEDSKGKLDVVDRNENDAFVWDVPVPELLESEIQQKAKLSESLNEVVSPEALAPLEEELNGILKSTETMISQDFFDIQSRPGWKQKLSEESWAVTKPVDTSTFSQMVPNPAMTFPFELDDFQKQAVIHLEAGESVFIAAHTSAGKTVVAEYAIALAMKHRTRVVYTSPIKALSNQKFRDFSKTFKEEEVGLVTGDVTINGTGSCLVMTTEILRSMLYRGADLVRDIEWVIFDEVHYINDSERGVVWEEVIIMLPSHVNLIFLSATTPNTVEFSSWIGRTKNRRVHVISTDRRPVPLEHYMFATGKMFKVLTAEKQFLRDGHVNACKALKNDVEEEKKKTKPGSGPNVASKKQQDKQKQNYTATRAPGFNEKTERSHWLNLVKELEKKELLPVVVFSFSKKMCDQRAAALESMNMTTALEKSKIHTVFAMAISRLNGSDKRLPQVLRVKELAKIGVGVHHGGLLPILKEVVEILFSRGLVKVLFATETFAIGVNMPARCVVFNGLRKHDGVQFRDLLPGEYTQMAGRAGRRGLDKVGTVIISCSLGKDPPSLDVLSQMMTGTATRLTSQFRLSYRMILSLLRVAELSVADMIKRSFSEFGTQRLIGGRDVLTMIAKGEDRLKQLREKLGTPCHGIAVYEKNRHSLQVTLAPLLESLLSGKFGKKPAQQILCPGRVILLTKAPNIALGFAMVVDPPKGNGHVFRVLVQSPSGSVSNGKEVLNYEGQSFYLDIVKPSHVVAVLSISAESIPDRLEDRVRCFGAMLAPFLTSCSSLCAGVGDIESVVAGSGAMCLLDPVNTLKVGEIDFVQAWRGSQVFLDELGSLSCHGCKNLQLSLMNQQKVSNLELKLLQAKQAVSDESLALFPDFKARLFVLQKMGYISRVDRAVQLKGRVACEINTCDELLLTEMIFDDVFGPLSPPECAAVCSALVMEKKSDDECILTESLEVARKQIKNICAKLEVTQKQARVEIDPYFYDHNVNFGLMEAVYEWARGMPFKDICKLTSLEEGSIVRVVTRLDETCREIRNAAQLIGDAALFKKLELASELIKRDIIFAASLYVA